MRLITLDFETYYDKEYSLSKLTTEEYIRDGRFEVIMVGVKEGADAAYTVLGDDVGPALRELRLEKCAVIAHHAQFDGFILSHHYGLRPKLWLDTLSMARGVTDGSVSLASMAKLAGLPDKGVEATKAIGKHLADFSPEELASYRGYCEHDVELAYALCGWLIHQHSKQEIRVMDMVIRMFTEPVLRLNRPLLEELHSRIVGDKAAALLRCKMDKESLMSNQKFADALRALGVSPPVKISPTTGRTTYAFSKSDAELRALAEHPDPDVQALVAARLGVKSTLAETRALRMLQMSERGAAPVYLQYCGARRTGRLSGGDKMNWQNYTRNKAVSAASYIGSTIITPDGPATLERIEGDTVVTSIGQFPIKKCHELGLRDTIMAPEGHVLVVVDSSNIEARVLAWLAGQEDAVERFRRKEDPYAHMASVIYGRPITKKDNPEERRLGKIAVLGLGYGMGSVKFMDTCRLEGITLSTNESSRIVTLYRQVMHKVCTLWRIAGDSLTFMRAGVRKWVVPDLVYTRHNELILPSGRAIRYPGLEHNDDTDEWAYFVEEKPARIYGGKVVENIVQAMARDIVMEQTLKLSNLGYKVVLSAHDEVVMCVPESVCEECLAHALAIMRTPPAWAETLPLGAEGGYHSMYGGVDK